MSERLSTPEQLYHALQRTNKDTSVIETSSNPQSQGRITFESLTERHNELLFETPFVNIPPTETLRVQHLGQTYVGHVEQLVKGSLFIAESASYIPIRHRDGVFYLAKSLEVAGLNNEGRVLSVEAHRYEKDWDEGTRVDVFTLTTGAFSGVEQLELIDTPKDFPEVLEVPSETTIFVGQFPQDKEERIAQALQIR